MKTITASKLRVELASIIKNLDAGPVHVTKHGKTIAVLTSPNAVVETPEEPKERELQYRNAHVAGSNPPPNLTYEDATPDQRDWYGLKEDEEEADDWDLSMDSDFENYLSKMMSHAIDRPRP